MRRGCALRCPRTGWGPRTLIGASSGTSLRSSGRRRRLPALLAVAVFMAVRLVVGHPPRPQGGSPEPAVGFAAIVADFSARAGDRRTGRGRPRASAVQRDVVGAVSSSPAPPAGTKRSIHPTNPARKVCSTSARNQPSRTSPSTGSRWVRRPFRACRGSRDPSDRGFSRGARLENFFPGREAGS